MPAGAAMRRRAAAALLPHAALAGTSRSPAARADAGAALPSAVACPSQTYVELPLRNVEAHPCEAGAEAQQWTLSAGGQLSVAQDGARLCAVVDGCGVAQCGNVVLLPCAETNASCSTWRAAAPAHADPSAPGASWLVAGASPAAEPRCAEIPGRTAGGNVDIYCCSGTDNCASRYPSPIAHQQWTLPESGAAGAVVSAAGGLCLTAMPPPPPPLDDAPVWPLPRSLRCGGHGMGPALSGGVSVSVSGGGGVAQAAAARYEPLLRAAGDAGGAVSSVAVSVASADDALGHSTNYSYTVDMADGASTVSVTAASPYGVAYALETLLQLSERRCASLSVDDAPAFPHRGLMIDTGRRFYPVPLVESMLDGMASVKMNVLHFHLSEECFRVESKRRPGLHTANCTVGGLSNNEYYTQDQITALVAYARARGIRVIPEFDMPGHSGGFCKGLKADGIQCCGSQIEDDADGKSVALIEEVLGEMSALFPDAVMNIGCDETGSSAPCTLDNTRSFEEKIIAFLQKEGKTVMGWEEILFKTQAAAGSPDVIVDAWARSSWQQAAQEGHRAVDSANGAFYLDSAGHSAAGMWKDIYGGTANATLRALLIGGETSMWQDNYVPSRVASCLFASPGRDTDFANSTSSMVWPRTAIAAGSFWRYDARLSPAGPLFADVLANVTRRLAARGAAPCGCVTPTHHGCSQNQYCGQNWC